MSGSNGVIDFSALTLAPEKKNPFGNDAREAKSEKEPTKIWINVGVRVPNPEVPGEFIQLNLPLGIPCDKMKPLPIPKDKDGKNPLFKQQRQAQAKLLEQFQTMIMATIKPGQRIHLEGFTVEVYHVEPGETLETADLSENPFMAGLAEKLSSKAEAKAGAMEAKTEVAASA